ncbi:transposase [Chloroflexota bacterium]
MHHIEGQDRNQLPLFIEALADYISADNLVRFLDAFVETLDIKALVFKNTTFKYTGRAPYRPGDLLWLYIYGYLNMIRSSRMMER